MSRGNNMRVRARGAHLAKSARQSASEFAKEWALRLDSWASELRQRADHADAFAAVNRAIFEFDACGVDSEEMRTETRRVMTDAACAAVAGVVDRRMHRLGNTAANCAKARDGTHKLR